MANFIEDHGDALAAAFGVVILLALAAAGIGWLAHEQLVQSCADLDMSYTHGQCVYVWTR